MQPVALPHAQAGAWPARTVRAVRCATRLHAPRPTAVHLPYSSARTSTAPHWQRQRQAAVAALQLVGLWRRAAALGSRQQADPAALLGRRRCSVCQQWVAEPRQASRWGGCSSWLYVG